MIAQDCVWVAADADQPVAFAATERFEDALHLWELAVRRDAQRRGVGRALLAAVVADAAARGLAAVTLTTFREIAWNGPLYRRLGFVELSEAELNPRLTAVRAREAALGLDVANRCAMRLPL
ncbi:GNAT family N-acetyltransferase [Phenylobacterium sp.]|uniref:GNAT family N-acetyltransferase n=1 Tax=Phenylobacterium sp. TaxID=1871053 RepID=UPI0025D133C0|nr:GNAT family N-acetyltransferase [Phenylobacterium sp.]